YVLRSWVPDVDAAQVQLLTRSVSPGRRTIVARLTDKGAGVDPFSRVSSYRGVVLGAAVFESGTGIADYPLPQSPQWLRAGRAGGTRARGARLATLPAGAAGGAAARARAGARRGVRALRRGPARRRRAGCGAGDRPASGDPPARQQRRHPRAGGLRGDRPAAA